MECIPIEVAESVTDFRGELLRLSIPLRVDTTRLIQLYLGTRIHFQTSASRIVKRLEGYSDYRFGIPFLRENESTHLCFLLCRKSSVRQKRGRRNVFLVGKALNGIENSAVEARRIDLERFDGFRLCLHCEETKHRSVQPPNGRNSIARVKWMGFYMSASHTRRKKKEKKTGMPSRPCSESGHLGSEKA